MTRTLATSVMRPKRRWMALLAVLTACSGSTPTATEDVVAEPTASTVAEITTTSTTSTTAPTTTTTEAPTTTTEAVTTTTEAPPTFDDPVRLLDPGAEPRRELRLDIADGAEFMDQVQTQTITQKLDGETITAAELTTAATSELRVVNEGDVLSVASTLLTMELVESSDPSTAPAMEAALAAGVGIETKTRMDRRGLVAASDFAGANGMTSDVLNATAQVSNPMPLEAVGVGAVWETVNNVELFGLAIEQLTTTTIIAIDGDVITMAIETSQMLEPGSVGIIDGQRITFELFEVSATGETVIDLTKAAPVRATSSVVTSQILDFGSGVLDQLARMESEITGRAE